MRSRPMPVSIDGAGSGTSVPSFWRSNSMNTLFQTSTRRSLSGTARFVAAIEVDLGAAAARAGVAHLPEVVVGAQLLDAIGRQVLPPDLVGLFVARDVGVAGEDGRVQLVLGQFPHVGELRPGEADGFFLEVVAEREVAEHLEERVMPQRRPDVVEVVVLAAHPHALLRGRRSLVVPPFASEEQVFELVHPGVREQQRRVVVRHERRTGHDPVPLSGEEIKERLTNFTRAHPPIITGRSARRTVPG